MREDVGGERRFLLLRDEVVAVQKAIRNVRVEQRLLGERHDAVWHGDSLK